MNKRTSLILHLLLLIIVVVELTGRFTDNISLEYPVKPLIMIWMAVYFLIFSKKKSFTIPVLLAFFFSWVGDILLMLSGRDERFFFAGVGGFFLAQITYIFIFTRYYEEKRKGYLRKNPLIIAPFLLYVGGIYFLLLPGLEGIMKPVILVYAISLMGMSMMALNRRGRVNPSSFRSVFTGSILFLVSDSMIAINKFTTEIPLAGFWIMITYILAQYLIMRGLVLEKS
ncbi:MAG: lysoplasmalogenase [Bacteroidales bacterium]